MLKKFNTLYLTPIWVLLGFLKLCSLVTFGVLHIFSEFLLLTELSFKLLLFFKLGYKCVKNFVCMVIYVSILSPAFFRVAWFYIKSPQVIRSVVYGSKPRNRLDLFLPSIGTEKKGKLAPVVVFVTGGMWIIGYKGWGALLGKRLMERGIVVACIDYRNFPQGTVSDMVQDVSSGVSWVLNNIQQYGGDPRRVTLLGQSAGAHLSSLALVRQARDQAVARRSLCSQELEEALDGSGCFRLREPQHWDLTAIHSFIGLSGGYDFNAELVDHFHKRGLYKAVFYGIMEAGLTGKRIEDALPRHSPEQIVKSDSFRKTRAASLLPRMTLLHGTADLSMPPGNASNFHRTLAHAGAATQVKYYEGKTHTDPFLEDPIKGGHDHLMEDVVEICLKGGSLFENQGAVIQPALLPHFMVNLARICMPF